MKVLTSNPYWLPRNKYRGDIIVRQNKDIISLTNTGLKIEILETITLRL